MPFLTNTSGNSPRRPETRWLTAACALLVTLAGLHSTWAETDERPDVVERQVKAAFLYKFGGYVTWPSSAFARPDSPIVIGIAGADLLADEIVRLVAGRTIGKRPVAVQRLQRSDSLDGVHILFVASTDSKRFAELLTLAQGRPVLLVTESERGLPAGSAVNFVVADNRVRFDVSPAAAEHQGLKLSALLLSVARQVHERTP
jgi:hypothetical protein